MEDVCFSPGTCCQRNIQYLINNSDSKIQIAVHHISNIAIFQSLVRARKRGVEVLLITDRRMFDNPNSIVYALMNEGIKVRMPVVNFEVNKFAIFDNEVLLTGSYSWTEDSNFQYSNDCLVLSDISIIKKYVGRFEFLWRNYDIM